LGEGWAVGRFPGQFLRRTELIKRSLRLDDEPKWWCREPLQRRPQLVGRGLARQRCLWKRPLAETRLRSDLRLVARAHRCCKTLRLNICHEGGAFVALASLPELCCRARQLVDPRRHVRGTSISPLDVPCSRLCRAGEGIRLGGSLCPP